MNWAILFVTLGVGIAEYFTDQFRLPTWIMRLQLNSRVPTLERFITYALVHNNWVHLLQNLLALYIFGNNINDRLGHVGYLAFYLAGAIVAGIGYALFDASGLPVRGASGAVMAVMGAYAALFPRSNITILSFLFFAGTFEVPSMYLIMVFFVFDLVGNFSGSVAVAHVAHITGMSFGFIIGLLFLAIRLVPRDPFDFLALLHRWNRRREYKTLVSQGYNPFSRIGSSRETDSARRLAAERAAEEEMLLDRILEMRAEINEAVAHHNLPHAAILFVELQRLDPRQVLSRQAQLDIANQLTSQEFFQQAADAYEQFLTHYPNYENIENVQLMLGLIYARYLSKHDRAKLMLQSALTRLHGEKELEMAKVELNRIGKSLPSDSGR